MTFVSFAQNREDVVLFRALKDVERGYYIDVGAHDPSVDSVTRAFYDRGWRGINLEPSPFWFSRLAAARPRDINLNLAASNTDGELEFDDIADTGLSTSNAVIGRHYREAGIYPVTRRLVAAASLKSICAAHAVAEVHFMKIDVEGTEHAVLEGMDFKAVRPWIVVVEAIDPISLAPTHGEWEHLLIDAGYEFVLFDGLNRFYFDSRRPELGARLAAPANVCDNFVVATWNIQRLSLPSGFGINLFGQFSSATGLGTTARQTARALVEAGVPLACWNVGEYYPTGDVSDELATIVHTFVTDTSHLRFPVNIYCLPVIDFPQLEQRIPGLPVENRFHAAVVWWETTKLHQSWRDALARLNAVITYSEFLSEVISNSLPLTSVLTGKQPLYLPEGVRANRQAFGFPDDSTIFLCSFDPASDPARKNPVAAITAFRQAFANREANVRLIFRLNNAKSTQMGRDTLRLLDEAAAGDGRIGFAIEPMSYREVLTLYASADVHVSLHRAEGLGLGMLESMRLGIPVIATAWSGNKTFMDPLCACLVRYRLTQVSGNHPFYRPEVLGSDALWAEPVIEDAIAWMRHLHNRPEDRRRIGEQGRQRAERYQQEAAAFDWLCQLAQVWKNAPILPTVEGKFGTPARNLA